MKTLSKHPLTLVLVLVTLTLNTRPAHSATPIVEKWSTYDVVLKGPASGNPFEEIQLSALFRNGEKSLTVPGFYDGNGRYVVRFSPDREGPWAYQTVSNVPSLCGKKGKLRCVKPAIGNHGPVVQTNTFYFRYTDGSPYFQVGTTCYQWTSQPKELQDQTVKTLSEAPFNKLRMCIFPKWYIYNRTEPTSAAYLNVTDTTYDFTRFNPAYWTNLEYRIRQLDTLGIEADIVLFHPYDKWGFATMSMAGYERYIRYAIARLSAFKNVWWSIANEFDFMTVPPRKNHSGNMQKGDWDHFFQLLQQEDPYQRMRSIHNGEKWYDHTQPWVTHASIQNSDLQQGLSLREKYNKPVVYDECRYEGNIEAGWGRLTPQVMTQRFWIGAMNGCYVGHGECIKAPGDVLWWAKGGVLRGESPKRIAFFRKFMEQLPFSEMKPSHLNDSVFVLSKAGEVCLVYILKSGSYRIEPEGLKDYRVESADTWNMIVREIQAEPLGTYRTATNDVLLMFSSKKRPRISIL